MRLAASRQSAMSTRRYSPWCTTPTPRQTSATCSRAPRTSDVTRAMDNLPAKGPLSCILVGIESHICITQTAIDLLRLKHKVYVIADGVSSCNKEEVPIALARLRHEGAIVTTSESFLYECVQDAGTPEYVQEALADVAYCTYRLFLRIRANFMQVQSNYQDCQGDEPEHQRCAANPLQDINQTSM
jgi:hypothetical protein